MSKYSDEITVIIKPTNMCNLRCKYCYHAERGYSADVISDTILEKCFSTILPNYRVVTYMWHGGEPLMLPLSFYDKVLELQHKYRTDNEQEIRNLMQSNGTLITDDVSHYLKKYNIGIQVSFDGPSNNEIRGHTEDTLRGIENLMKQGLNVNVISVVGSHNVNRLQEIYNYSKEKNFTLRLNPMFASGNAMNNRDILLNEKEYVEGMCSLFDFWSRDEMCNISIPSFEEYVQTVMFNKGKSCSNSMCLYRWISIDHNGDIYPCGRAYTIEYNMGNIEKFSNIREVFETELYKEYVRRVDIRHSKCKENCELYKFCRANCNNSAIIENGLENIPEFSCNTYKRIFYHVRSRLLEIRNDIFLARKVRINSFIKEQFGLVLSSVERL
ncbi:radical SAM protein [Ruminiclostridium herbifermentans]|uniref:Radical SAM protein n=1 Tax=Ruminiclostridium herbifermentans TaxID=2488810 RepID=A0A4U7JLW2_9FIRM|nr:radical SAM protein [Ruminiclostridium herbifermentans]QNU66182.1 radical SAM protein [Ruminiclostridium herbifermentans]